MFLAYLTGLISTAYLGYLLVYRPPQNLFEWALAFLWICFGAGPFLLMNLCLLVYVLEKIDGHKK